MLTTAVYVKTLDPDNDEGAPMFFRPPPPGRSRLYMGAACPACRHTQPQGRGGGARTHLRPVVSAGSFPPEAAEQGRRWLEEHKPVLAMAGLQLIYAGVALLGKAALSQGMSSWVYVAYRQGIAALAIAPAAYFSHRKNKQAVPGRRGFCLVFIAALVGIMVNQNCYFMGLRLGSSSMATAMANLVPAVTFLMAATLGLERVSMRSPRSMAKVVGTVVCVGGAVTMALVKGPKLLLHMGLLLQTPSSLLHAVGEDWMMGCLFLFGSCCCWSAWLILQVPITRCCSNPLSLSALMCFLGFLQSTVLAFFMEHDKRAWRLDSNLQIACCIYAGVAGSGVTIWVQAWCISRRGPLFSAMFNPLCTVITTISAFIFLHEELHLGSLVGAVAVVSGLYIVLWGKAEDVSTSKQQGPEKCDHIAVEVDGGQTARSCRSNGLGEPLLAAESQQLVAAAAACRR